jgi:UDP-glucose 4-epimerase
MNIIVTGGAGYIGSHVCKDLKKNKFNPIVIDDLSTGHKRFVKWGPLEIADINSYKKIDKILKKYQPVAIIHLAAKASIAESFLNPKKYYFCNVIKSNNLIKCMIKNKIKKIIFSSSCSVYGNTNKIKIKENEKYKPLSPYALSKVLVEKNLQKQAKLNNVNFISLRYFNAAGADKETEIGEDHIPENHLIPLTIKAGLKKNELKINGTKYNTKDGTCIRDYIHVSDIADGHVKALKKILKLNSYKFINLGSGKGFSVLEIINKIEKILKRKIKIKFANNRKGDAARLVSSITLAKKYLKWSPKRSSLNNILKTAIKWHRKTNLKY